MFRNLFDFRLTEKSDGSLASKVFEKARGAQEERQKRKDALAKELADYTAKVEYNQRVLEETKKCMRSAVKLEKEIEHLNSAADLAQTQLEEQQKLMKDLAGADDFAAFAAMLGITPAEAAEEEQVTPVKPVRTVEPTPEPVRLTKIDYDAMVPEPVANEEEDLFDFVPEPEPEPRQTIKKRKVPQATA